MTSRRRGAPGRRPAPVLVGLLLAVSGLAACSSGTDDYCSVFTDKQSALDSIGERAEASPGFDQLTPTLEIYTELRAAAPEALVDEYDTVIFAYRDLLDAVADAGVAPEDFRAGEAPPGLTKQETRKLAQVADKLTSIRVLEAAAGIEDYGSQVCPGDQPSPAGAAPVPR